MDGDKSKGLWGGLSSWEDTDGTRYILAPVWGPVSAEMQTAVPDAHVPNGSIVVFKMQDKDGIATLAPAWVSPDLESPTLPVIAKGVVFALANGRFSNSHKGLSPRKGSHATLFALDGATGKQIYSTGEQVTAAGNLAGMTIANGRIYFATVDGTLQVFGKYLER
jgi:outer membrane protein assembly factor BamB